MEPDSESYYPYGGPYGGAYGGGGPASNTLNPLEWIEPLSKNRWAFGLIVTGALLVAFLYNLYATPIYSARSSVIFRQNVPVTPIREKEAELQKRVDPKAELKTKEKIIASRPLILELVKRLIDKGYFQPLLKAKKYARMSLEEKAQLHQALAMRIQGSLSVENMKDTNILNIEYQSADPEVAKEVVNTLADIVVEFHRNEQLRVMKDNLYYLNQQLEEAKRKVEEAEQKLFDYRIKHNIFDTEADKGLIDSQRTALEGKLILVQEERKQIESQISQLQDLLKRRDYLKYTPVITDNHVLGELKRQLVDTEIAYQKLLVRYGEKHPDVIKAEGEVEVLKKKFEQELTGALTKLEFDLNVIKSRQEFITKSLSDLEQSAVISTEKDIEYVVLDREANSARDIYKMLLGAVKEVNISTNSFGNNVIYVHEKAITPKRPIRPRKSVNMFLGLLLGGILGGMFAYGREYINQTIRTQDDVIKNVNLPVLATVPLYSARGHKKKTIIDRPLYVSHSPKSLFSEGISTLRSQLSIKLPQESPKILAVTSCAPREGKSLIAANLALSLAMNGYRTLLIDSDLHHPVVHKIFGFDRHSLGLYDLVVDAMNPEWSELDFNSLSLGDIQHLIRLKEWSGTIKIKWDTFTPLLNISYEEGRLAGSNLSAWREELGVQNGIPFPRTLSFSMDENEILYLDHNEESLYQVMEFIHQYPALNRSSYFSETVLSQYVRPSEHRNLFTMSAGTSPKNPSEILGSEQVKILIHILKEKFDRVIMDTPPAWPLSDVSVISPLLDGILWVCRAGEIPKNLFIRTVQQIQQVQPNIIGVIINAVDLHRDRYYYYGYPSYYYYRYYRSKYYGESVVEYPEAKGKKEKE